jgi:RNA polymerase sigma factor (TIGR02999 family)
MAAEEQDDDPTDLVRRWSAGDATALDHLLPLVYADLRAIAARELRGHRGHETLQPTALVHDVFVRLLGGAKPNLQNRAHLFNSAARIMRQLLVDRARRAASEKHGGLWRRSEFTEALALPIPEDTRLTDLDEALGELAALDERLARVVELRYFTGLTVPEVAVVLEVDQRTIYRDWAAARAWLRDRLGESAADSRRGRSEPQG